MPLQYAYKTEPRSHQRELLEATSHLPYFAVFWEMGAGKTKFTIDNIAVLFEEGLIDGALIIAPNGVDLNWSLDEIPKHLPDRILKQSRIFRYTTKKSGTKAHKEQVKWNREHSGLAWLLMSYDAFMTDDGKEAALLFLEQRKCFYVLDESVSIKTPGAKRTMRITRTAHRAKYRRILDGYPTPKGAFDLYSQIQFLDPTFWKRHQWDSFAMFKAHFGVFEKRRNHNIGVDYDEFIGFKNLEELNRLVAPISSRVLKRDVLDLPEKIYQSRYFELTSKQRELYDSLEEEYRVWVDTDQLVTANLAMVRELRLQQISCGYLPIGEGEPVHRIEGKNPRLELQESLLENRTEKTIIWARYKLDIQLLVDMLKTKKNRKFVLYTGDTEDEDRLKARREFQEGDAEFFIATPMAAGIGLTLHAAQNMDYYSNGFNLRHRKQSEDRAHRDGLKHELTITDLLGHNTRDKKIMLNLCGKMDTGDIILGDKGIQHDIRTQLKEWLERE